MNSVVQLQGVLPQLSPRDRDFAQSLLAQSAKRPLSEKQMYWVGKLVEKATMPVATVALGGSDTVGGIVEIINRNNNAKFPAIRFLAGEKQMRLAKAGKTARFPGSLNVLAINPHTKERVWYGRIHLDGRFEFSSKALPDKAPILDALRAFVADPAEAAREYGKKTGLCCFCGLLLNDERSLLMGYGPICAGNYQLPWGTRPEEEVAS